MIARLLASSSLVLLVGTTAASADVVHLTDGRSHRGDVERAEDGGVVVRTLHGEVRVPSDSIDRVEERSDLARELAEKRRRVGSNDAAGLIALSQWAIRKGLWEEALDLSDLALNAVHRGRAKEAVGLPLELMHLPVSDVGRDSELDAESTRRLLLATGGRKPARAIVARARLQELATRYDVTDALLKGLRDVSADVRRTALRVLATTTPEDALEPVLRAMLFDRDPAVRKEATVTAKAFAHEGIVYPVARAIEQDDAALREAGMDAAELLDDPRVVGALVRLLKRADSAGKTRNHSANVTHTSYVKDFDVEIAQAAVIAQPIVGVLQHGTVHDVGVAGVFERRVPRGQRDRAGRLLSRFTGQSFGTDWRKWEAWLAEQQSH